MKDIVKKSSREIFYVLSLNFAESLHEHFPECPESKDLLLYSKNIVRGNQELEEEGIKTWCDRMMQPLNESTQKRSSALQVNLPLCTKLACTKMHSPFTTRSLGRLGRLRLDVKMADKRLEDKDKDNF